MEKIERDGGLYNLTNVPLQLENIEDEIKKDSNYLLTAIESRSIYKIGDKTNDNQLTVTVGKSYITFNIYLTHSGVNKFEKRMASLLENIYEEFPKHKDDVWYRWKNSDADHIFMHFNSQKFLELGFLSKIVDVLKEYNIIQCMCQCEEWCGNKYD